MSRKWLNIREKKAKADQQSSKLYAKFGIEIYAAARSGEPDPELNQKLKFVIDRAKTYDVPNHVIQRAIEKAKGSDEEQFHELRYEGFGPNGAMLIVEALSNNVNRTASDVRSTFSKNGGNMGVSGSVSYLFDNTAVFVFDGTNPDEVMMELLENDIEVRDVIQEDNSIIVYADPENFNQVKSGLESLGIEHFDIAELDMIPKDLIKLKDSDLKTFEKLVDSLENFEDVQKVFHNVDLP